MSVLEKQSTCCSEITSENTFCFSGEFGIVYKAHWVRSMQCATGYAMPDVVAAKTLKG